MVTTKETVVLKSINSEQSLCYVNFESVSLLRNLHEATAYTRVDDTSSGRGTITCPNLI